MVEGLHFNLFHSCEQILDLSSIIRFCKENLNGKYIHFIHFSPLAGFYFLDKNLNIKIRKYKHKDETIFVYGNPIINEKINPGSQVLFEEVLKKKNYTKVNGSFIFFIFNNKKNELLIINDRFASRKLFYTYINNIFFASSSFKLIYELKKE